MFYQNINSCQVYDIFQENRAFVLCALSQFSRKIKKYLKEMKYFSLREKGVDISCMMEYQTLFLGKK